jgi:putative aldouronate transport system permease protein
MGSLLAVNAEKVILLYRPATYEVSDILSSYIYRLGIAGGRFDYTTAIGLFNSVIGMFLLVITNMISKKVSDTSLF